MKKFGILLALLLAVAGDSFGQLIPVGGGSSGGTAFTGGSVTNLSLTKALGAELVTHTCAGWGLSAPVGAWSCSGTTITRTASGANLTITNAAPTALSTYEVVWTITRTAGTVTIGVGGTSGTARSSSATYTEEPITAAATTAVTITADASFAGTITAVSVKPYTDLVTSSAGPLVFKPSTSIRLVPASTYGVQTFGSLLFGFDNTNDIGASGATRPRTGYFGTSVISPVIDSGAATNLLLKYNGTTQATVDSIGLMFGTGKYLYSNGAGVLDAWRLVVRNRTSDGSETGSPMEVVTNAGATTLVTRTLETAANGVNYCFYVADTDGLKISANTGDDIRIAGTVTASGGYIRNSTIGSGVCLVAIDADHWVAINAPNGTWTFDTP